jgi:DNA-binding LacI/PurR family transcriptional regulator
LAADESKMDVLVFCCQEEEKFVLILLGMTIDGIIYHGLDA